MKIFLVLSFLVIIAIFVYLLIKASDECTKSEEKINDMQLKLSTAETKEHFFKKNINESAQMVANALVHLNSMGPQEGENKTYLIAAQKELMDAHEKLEKL